MNKSKALRKLLTSGKNPEDRIIFHPILMQFAARQVNATYTEFMTDYRILVE